MICVPPTVHAACRSRCLLFTPGPGEVGSRRARVASSSICVPMLNLRCDCTPSTMPTLPVARNMLIWRRLELLQLFARLRALVISQHCRTCNHRIGRCLGDAAPHVYWPRSVAGHIVKLQSILSFPAYSFCPLSIDVRNLQLFATSALAYQHRQNGIRTLG